MTVTDGEGHEATFTSAATAAVAVLPTVTVASGGDATEGDAAAFTLTRTGGSSAPVLVVNIRRSVSGDFVVVSFATVSFPARASTTRTRLHVGDDKADEEHGAVTMTVLPGNGYRVGTPGAATAKILDATNVAPAGAPTIDDTSPVVGEVLTADPSGIADADGLTSRTFTWQWVRVSGGTETLVGGATAAAYAVVAADVGATLKVRATFTDDGGVEETVESAETAAVEAASLPTVTVAPRSTPVSEGAPAAEFTVTRTGDATAALRVRIRVSETGDMVAAGNEGAGARTIPAGSGSAVIPVPTVDDAAHEADSAVTLALEADAAYALGAAATASVAVEDDDNAAPTGAPTIDDATPVVGETLTASASGVGDPDGLAGATFTWQWIRVSGGADTRISGATSETYAVVAGDVGATLKVEARFTDDDGTGETVTSAETAAVVRPAVLSIGDARVDEGDTGSVTLGFAVTLDRAATEAVRVDWATSDGSARAGTDYTAGSGTVTFGAGDSRRTVSVTVAGDMVDEPNETLTVTLSGASGATVGDGVATGTITDDDDAPAVTLVLTPASVSEAGGQSTVTARLDRPSSEATVVAVSAAPVAPAVAGDYTLSASTALTIAAGRTASTGVVAITAVDDTVDAPHKTVTVSATATNAQGVTAPSSVTLTIRDDDDAPAVTLRLSSDSISEAVGQSTVTATLDRASSAATTVTVTVAPVAPAVAGDYTLSASTALTIAAGRTASTGTVTITAVDNAVDAPHKTVTVSATAANAQGVTAPGSVTLTVRDDDDAPAVTLRLSPDSVGEAGGTSTVTAALDRPSSEETTVTVSAAPVAPAVAGDYTLSGSRLTIAPGATASTGTVTVTGVDDDVVTGTKQVTVSGVAANAQGIGGPPSVTLSIADDDAPGLSIADASVAEGDTGSTPMTFTVVLSPVALSTVTVDWATADATARAGTDYAAASGRLAFGAGDSRRTVTVMVSGDGVDEPDRTFTVVLSGASGAAVSDGTATGTIRDDDDPPAVTLVLVPDSIAEAGGRSEVTALLDRASSEETTVTVSAAPVAPAVAGDYALDERTVLTIAAGRTMSARTVAITGVDNAVDAPHKTVTVSAAAANALGGDGGRRRWRWTIRGRRRGAGGDAAPEPGDDRGGWRDEHGDGDARPPVERGDDGDGVGGAGGAGGGGRLRAERGDGAGDRGGGDVEHGGW